MEDFMYKKEETKKCTERHGRWRKKRLWNVIVTWCIACHHFQPATSHRRCLFDKLEDASLIKYDKSPSPWRQWIFIKLEGRHRECAIDVRFDVILKCCSSRKHSTFVRELKGRDRIVDRIQGSYLEFQHFSIDSKEETSFRNASHEDWC